MLLKLFKKFVPKTNETKEVESVVTWQVRWNSLNQFANSPSYVRDKPEVAVFTDSETAERFKESLEQAFVLLKYKGQGNQNDLKNLVGIIVEEVRT